jgi:hypothetical protein
MNIKLVFINLALLFTFMSWQRRRRNIKSQIIIFINIGALHPCQEIMPKADKPVGYMVQTHCSYSAPIEYPNVYLGGVSVEKIGKSSVHYKVSNIGL